MASASEIPVFGLFGETDGFPDAVHVEDLSARAPKNDWYISAHRHGQMVQVFLFDTGEIGAQVDGRSLALNGGDFLFVPALCVHAFRFQPETKGLVLSVPSSVAHFPSASAQGINAALSQVVTGPTPADVMTLARLLFTAHRSTGAFRAQRSVGLAQSLLARLAEVSVTTSAPGPRNLDSKLQRLDELIADHMADGWSASDYAAELAVTTGHLSRLSRTATGLGVTAYIERKTIEEACRLLAFTQIPISAVGFRLGFADPSYFTKRFQKAMKQSPSRYRARFMS